MYPTLRFSFCCLCDATGLNVRDPAHVVWDGVVDDCTVYVDRSPQNAANSGRPARVKTRVGPRRAATGRARQDEKAQVTGEQNIRKVPAPTQLGSNAPGKPRFPWELLDRMFCGRRVGADLPDAVAVSAIRQGIR